MPVGARLTRLRIEKFRSIRRANIETGELLALVGQNSSGKTSILRALNAFFNFGEEEAAFRSGEHRFSSKSYTTIEVEIEGLGGSGLPLMNSTSSTLRAKLKFRKRKIVQCYVNGNWETAPSDFFEKLQQYISFALIPNRRDHEVADPSGKGLLLQALEQWLQQAVSRDRRTPKILNEAEIFKKRTLSKFEKELDRFVGGFGGVRFAVDYAVAPDLSLLLQNLNLYTCDGENSFPLSESGSGTQNLAVFSLYSMIAQIQNKNFILGFEEPEQNLHPQAQRQLLNHLKDLSLQTIFTTHSPVVIDALEHEQVVLCKRVKGARGRLECHASQIGEKFFARNKLDREKYYKFHQRKNSDFFFSPFVIVTESPVDASVLRRILEGQGLNLDEMGYSLIDANGVSSLQYLYFLLKELEIPFLFVVDKDFFLNYKNSNREGSLNAVGYPQYSPGVKSGNVIDDIIPSKKIRGELSDAFLGNHSKALDILEPLGFVCFRFAMEIDLVASGVLRKRFFDALSIPAESQDEALLLKEKSKAIKRQDVLLEVVSDAPRKNLPHSYGRVIKIIADSVA